jgi:hypothetical protein
MFGKPPRNSVKEAEPETGFAKSSRETLLKREASGYVFTLSSGIGLRSSPYIEGNVDGSCRIGKLLKADESVGLYQSTDAL